MPEKLKYFPQSIPQLAESKNPKSPLELEGPKGVTYVGSYPYPLGWQQPQI